MINLIANKELKNLGCKWTGSEWKAPELAKDEADAIKAKFYSDLVAVEITVNATNKGFKGQDWAFNHARSVAGYVVATTSGRDAGAKIATGVAVLNGTFDSGGSRKNFACTQSDAMKLRMEVGKNVLSLLDEEVAEGRYSYVVLSKQTLATEKNIKLEIKFCDVSQTYYVLDENMDGELYGEGATISDALINYADRLTNK